MGDRKVIAVVGATGNQGRGLVRAILADRGSSFRARALTRNPGSAAARALAAEGAEVVKADLDDQDTLVKAFTGAHGAFVVTNFWENLTPQQEAERNRLMLEQQHAANAAEAAKRAGLKHVIWSTMEDTRQTLTDDRCPTVMGKYKVPHLDGKAEANAFFTSRGVPTTFLLTTFYYEAFLRTSGLGPVRGENGQLVLTLPVADASLPAIAVSDIGRTSYGIFKAGGSLIGKTIGIAGEHLTGQEFSDHFTKAFGEKVIYHPLTFDQVRALPIPRAGEIAGMFQFYVEATKDYRAARDVKAARALNPELQPFGSWLEEHKEEILPA